MIVKEEGDPEPTHHQVMSFADQLNNLEADHFTDEKPSFQEEEEDEDHCANLSQMRMAFPDERRIREQSEQAIDFFHELDDEEEPEVVQKDPKEQSFNRKSFQDFSLKKFTELMDEKKMNDFMDSVQRTFRENEKPPMLKEDSPIRTARSKKEHAYSSPAKSARKEMELDSLAGSNMKILSEQKRRADENMELFENRQRDSELKELLSRSVDQRRQKAPRKSRITPQSPQSALCFSEVLNKPKANNTATSILNKEFAELLNRVDPKTSNPFENSPTTSYSVLNRADQNGESPRRSDVRGLDIEDVQSAHASSSRDEKLQEIGNNIGQCFPEEVKEEHVSPMSSSLSRSHGIEDQIDTDPIPEINADTFFNPSPNKSESPEKDHSLDVAELIVEEVPSKPTPVAIETAEVQEQQFIYQNDVDDEPIEQKESS